MTLDIGRIKHGNRTYSFRSEDVQEFICCIRRQIEIIANLVQERRRATIVRPNLSHKGVNSDPQTASPKFVHVYADACDQLDESDPNTCQEEYNYENVDSNSTHKSDNDSSSEFQSFPDSIEYEEPGTSTLSSTVKYELPACDSSTEFSSYCTDIYPFFNNSFDSKDFIYEISGLDSDRRASAPEANIVYQDVDIDFYPSRESFVRRKLSLGYKHNKPTFVSYIEGGSQALKSVYGGRNRFYSEPNQINFELEGSGVYSRLYDPKLVDLDTEQTGKSAREDAEYDVLHRDLGTRLIRPHSSVN